MLEEELAFEALPSHDAQSIAGILSTDVHGTGRDWGFVSESVVRLKLINGKGEIHDDLRPSDDLFKAAIGGVGAVGIILEVTVQAVDSFRVEQKFEIADLAHVEANLDQLLQKNDHFSLYLFPFADNCQISTWNRTPREKSFLGPFLEFVAISLDALLGAWFGNFLAYTGLLPPFSTQAHSLKQGTDLVMESNRAFNRTIYHLHQELEFTVPFEHTFDMCRRFIDLYEKIYLQTKLPYVLFEVRFTPAGHGRSLMGAGRERRNTWIDLVCNDSAGFEVYYAEAEKLIKRINTEAGESVKETGVRPHLGKFCKSLDSTDMERLHGEHFRKFRQLMRDHDPEGKFANGFTRRLFGV